jgi:DNA-directed RNA polymerase specialized sigma24 family protein
MRPATMAELDTLRQGMAPHAPRYVVQEAATHGTEAAVVLPLVHYNVSPDDPEEAEAVEELSEGEWEPWLTRAQEALPAAITGLPWDEQRVVIGYYFDQRSVAELADTLHHNRQHVRSLIQDALSHLRRALLH